MADELKVTSSLKFSKNGIDAESSDDEESFDVTGTKHIQTEQTIATTATALEVGDLAATRLGAIRIKNTDDTNYVSAGIKVSSTFYPTQRILPGETWTWRYEPNPSSTAELVPWFRANTASVNIKFLLIEA